jgi:hypothetical protein
VSMPPVFTENEMKRKKEKVKVKEYK